MRNLYINLSQKKGTEFDVLLKKHQQQNTACVGWCFSNPKKTFVRGLKRLGIKYIITNSRRGSNYCVTQIIRYGCAYPINPEYCRPHASKGVIVVDDRNPIKK